MAKPAAGQNGECARTRKDESSAPGHGHNMPMNTAHRKPARHATVSDEASHSPVCGEHCALAGRRIATSSTLPLASEADGAHRWAESDAAASSSTIAYTTCGCGACAGPCGYDAPLAVGLASNTDSPQCCAERGNHTAVPRTRPGSLFDSDKYKEARDSAGLLHTRAASGPQQTDRAAPGGQVTPRRKQAHRKRAHDERDRCAAQRVAVYGRPCAHACAGLTEPLAPTRATNTRTTSNTRHIFSGMRAVAYDDARAGAQPCGLL